MKKSRYNRRLAAISFLSNITLDGSPRVFNRPMLSSATSVREKGAEEVINIISYDNEAMINSRFSSSGNSLILKQRNESLNTSMEQPTKFFDQDSSIYFAPIRERASTTGSEYYSSEKHVFPKKKLIQQYSIMDDKNHAVFSSSESMSSTTGSKKDYTLVKLGKGKKLRGQRIIVVSQAKRVPFSVFSIIPYNRPRGDNKPVPCAGVRRRNTSTARPLSAINDPLDLWASLGMEKSCDGQEISYGQLLAPSRNIVKNTENEPSKLVQSVTRGTSYDSSTQRPFPSSPPIICCDNKSDECAALLYYEANMLDDPELIAGRHRTHLTFTSYMTSIIHYTRPGDLKRELNDKFRDKFPQIQLTLSKLRSIKRELRKIANQDLLTVAYAYVYFEKLIVLKLINKENRKLCAGAALILAAKLNDMKGEQLKHLIEKTEAVLRINRRELLASEFAVLVALEFGLHIPTCQVLPHYQRLLSET